MYTYAHGYIEIHMSMVFLYVVKSSIIPHRFSRRHLHSVQPLDRRGRVKHYV